MVYIWDYGTSTMRPTKMAKKKGELKHDWCVSGHKDFFEACGFWRSEQEQVSFRTIANVGFCDLKVVSTVERPPDHIHVVSPEIGNRCRLRPKLGDRCWFEKLEGSDERTIMQYFPITMILRVFYPPKMRLLGMPHNGVYARMFDAQRRHEIELDIRLRFNKKLFVDGKLQSDGGLSP